MTATTSATSTAPRKRCAESKNTPGLSWIFAYLRPRRRRKSAACRSLDEPAGDVADALYLVVSGAVDVVDGAEVVARYGPEEVFGEAVLVPGEQRAVTTRVALDAVLLVLPRGSLDYLFELHPSLHQRVSVLL